MKKLPLFEYCEKLLTETQTEELFAVNEERGLVSKIRFKGKNVMTKKINLPLNYTKKIKEIFDKETKYEALDFLDWTVYYILNIDPVKSIISDEIKIHDENYILRYVIRDKKPYPEILKEIMDKTLEHIKNSKYIERTYKE